MMFCSKDAILHRTQQVCMTSSRDTQKNRCPPLHRLQKQHFASETAGAGAVERAFRGTEVSFLGCRAKSVPLSSAITFVFLFLQLVVGLRTARNNEKVMQAVMKLSAKQIMKPIIMCIRMTKQRFTCMHVLNGHCPENLFSLPDSLVTKFPAATTGSSLFTRSSLQLDNSFAGIAIPETCSIVLQ